MMAVTPRRGLSIVGLDTLPNSVVIDPENKRGDKTWINKLRS